MTDSPASRSPAFLPAAWSGPAVLAVDGGGTKTAAVRVGQDGQIQGYYTTSGSNPFDQPDWQQILSDLVLPLSTGVQAAVFGLAGYGENRALGQTIRAHLHTLCPDGTLSLSNDVDMACTGAFAGNAGVLLLSGTGSMAWAHDGNGNTARVGGWGGTFGDEGSAYWIGRTALQFICQALDGRKPEAVGFAQAVCTHMGWPTTAPAAMDALLGWHAEQPRPRSAVAQCARLVDELAAEGCAQATALLKDAAAQLAAHIHTARARLGGDTLPWSYAGSVFNSPRIRAELTALCGAPQLPTLPPLGGGVLRAARQAGWSIDSQWIATLAQSLKNLPSSHPVHPPPVERNNAALSSNGAASDVG